MIEALRTHVTNDELKELRKYGNKITVRPYTLEFSTEVPSHVIRKIFDLFDIWVNNYEIPTVPISENSVFDVRNRMFKTTDKNGFEIEFVPERQAVVDISSLYLPFFNDLQIKVKTSEMTIYPEGSQDIDFIPAWFGEPQTVAVTASENLAYGNEYAPAIANTAFFDLFFRALTSPQYIEHGHISNANEKISVNSDEDGITITRSTKGGESHSIKISNLNFRKRNIKTIQIFSYLFQKLAATPGAKTVYVEYDELVKIGMYETIDGARRGVHNFYDFFHGTDEKGKKHIPGVTVKGVFKIKRSKVNQKERDLVIGRDLTEGGQTVFFNPYCDLRIFTAFTSFFPLWAYRLNNLEAFLLVRYIFYTARMNGGKFKRPDKADSIEGHQYKYFTLMLDSIRDAIGLPSPADVTGRKYKEKIRTPLEEAIEDVEAEIERINDPEQSVLVTLTPIGTDEAKNIEAYLRCEIEIGIIVTFADKFIKAAKEHEKKLEQFKERVEKAIAKNTAATTD